MSFEQILMIGSILLVVSIFASKLSDFLGIPTFLLFLFIGMLAGSDGFGGIHFENYRLAQFMGMIALIFILFAGGLETDWKSIRPVIWSGLSLSTFGVLITAFLVGLFAVFALKFSLLQGLLLGAIVSSTDAAAVFSVLKSRNSGLKGQLKPLLELESGSNDPMAVFLTLGLIQFIIMPQSSILNFLGSFFLQMTIGAVFGYLCGRLMTILINRIRLKYEGLYPVLTLALVALTYGVTVFCKGNGFLAIYIAAIVLGNRDFIHKKSLLQFHDGLAWLMQFTMFLTLGLLVFPSQLVPIIGAGLLVSLFLIIFARPVSVFIALAFSKMSFSKKAFVSWVGLRGAVPIILATFPLLAGVPNMNLIFNIVFFIVLTSALIQGTTIPLMAKWLKVASSNVPKIHWPFEFMPTGKSTTELNEVNISKGSYAVGKQIVELGLPREVLIILITRNDEFFIPKGSITIEEGDKLLVLTQKRIVQDLNQFFISGNPVRIPELADK